MNENRYFYMEHKSTISDLTDEKGWFLALAPTTASRLGPGYKGLSVVWYEGKRKPDKAKHTSMHSSHGSFFPWREVKPFEVPAEVVARFKERYPEAPSGTAQPRGFEGWESPKQHISVDRNEAHDWLRTHGFSPDAGSSRYYNSAGDIGRITDHGNMAEERAGRGWVVTVQPKGGGSETETRVYPGKPKPAWAGGKRRHAAKKRAPKGWSIFPSAKARGRGTGWFAGEAKTGQAHGPFGSQENALKFAVSKLDAEVRGLLRK